MVIYIYTYMYHLLQLALMVFSFHHWREQCTCTQATCTGLLWSVVVVIAANIPYQSLVSLPPTSVNVEAAGIYVVDMS